MKYDINEIRGIARANCPYDIDDNPYSADNFCQGFIAGVQWIQDALDINFASTAESYERGFTQGHEEGLNEASKHIMAQVYEYMKNHSWYNKDWYNYFEEMKKELTQ